MACSTTRIDSHVHFYTAEDLARVADGLPYALPEPHPLCSYLDGLIDAGIQPRLLNNVHLSILPDSENVFASFRELQALQTRDPARYGGVRLVGTIKADPFYATSERLQHPQIVGVRIVLHDAKPESVAETAYRTSDWQSLFARLRPDQHVHVYAKESQTCLRVLYQIPRNVRVVLDHLGNCHGERGPAEAAYSSLLAEAKRRGNVSFKGPGYRTSLDPVQVARFALRVIDELGVDHLLLEATDAPHVGASNDGVRFVDVLTPSKTYEFVDTVARILSAEKRLPIDQLLRGASHCVVD